MNNELRYDHLRLASGLVVPVGIATKVFVKTTKNMPKEFGMKVEKIGWHEITPSNSCYRTLVLEFMDDDELNLAFARRVLEAQGLDYGVVSMATVHIR